MKINTIELIISAVRESQYPTDQKRIPTCRKK